MKVFKITMFLIISMIFTAPAYSEVVNAVASSSWINYIDFQLGNDSNWEEYTYDGEPAFRMLWNQSNAAAMAGFGRIPYAYENAEYMSLCDPDDYKADFIYQCVGFIKAVSNLGSTTTWIRGPQITDTNLPQRGDILATFYGINNAYGGHTLVVWAADNEKITVIDQNWEENNLDTGGKIIKHVITFGGSTINNASNYHWVRYDN